MRAAAIIALTGSVLGGCSDGACIEGVCPDLDEPRALPGPCVAATDSWVDNCSFTYTSAGRIALARCQVWNSFGDYTEERNTVWSYDGSEQVIGIVESAELPRLVLRSWKWDATQVQKLGSGNALVATYDRATFAFFADSWAHMYRPHAELGLLATGAGSARVDYQWSRTGNHLERTGTDGSHATAELDDAGRLVSFDDGVSDDRFTYEGDRLIRREAGGARVDYRYDRGGNLAEVVSPDAREVYDYSCW
ncbi:MAG: hypothetical protein JNL83_06000 [Myxococcales bacterium]|nr:hypothetical protein [Myxococcales bacterium]